uniref:Uncharacterized protein n=1 Tax=Rhizophora mucronata TaxID=61149 RepID=A0A2P2J844_RHIMU
MKTRSQQVPASLQGFLFTPYDNGDYMTCNGDSHKSLKLSHPVPYFPSTPHFLTSHNSCSMSSSDNRNWCGSRKDKRASPRKYQLLPFFAACYKTTMATTSLTQSSNTYINFIFTIELFSHSTTMFTTNKCPMSLENP